VSKVEERRWQGFGAGLPMFPEAKIVERCVHCDFTVSAVLEEARQAFERHECDRPKPTTTLRRRRGFSSFARAQSG
jgi:hypothetical protein